MKLSAAIITFNEERNLERCLKSLEGIADEIIVVDSFSTDATRNIAERYGARFIEHAFEGHIQQKNYALDQTAGDWILSLDADEALDETLRASIRSFKALPSGTGYTMNRLTNYCGHWVRHCGWYPDTKLRLIRRGKARWAGVNPHDKLCLLNDERPVHLQGDILHYSYYTREDHLKQIEYFGNIAARELHERGVRVSLATVVLKVIAQFVKSYVIKAGFFDGSAGFTISRLSAFATWRKYQILRALNKKI